MTHLIFYQKLMHNHSATQANIPTEVLVHWPSFLHIFTLTLVCQSQTGCLYLLNVVNM